MLGCVLTLQLGAFSVVLETTLSGITDLPFGAFCAIMQPIHLAIGLIEGLITAAVLLFLYEARPELLRDVRTGGETAGKVSFKGTIAVIAIAAVLVGGGLSLLASGNPDGLEWSLFGNSDAGYTQNMGLDEDSYGVQSSAADKAGAVQEKTAFLPDYSFAGERFHSWHVRVRHRGRCHRGGGSGAHLRCRRDLPAQEAPSILISIPDIQIRPMRQAPFGACRNGRF